MDIHTPSMPKIPGRTSTGTIIKITVLQNDKIADVFPSFNAVNQPDANTLQAIIRKLVATIRKPCSAIASTWVLFFAKNPTTILPVR